MLWSKEYRRANPQAMVGHNGKSGMQLLAKLYQKMGAEERAQLKATADAINEGAAWANERWLEAVEECLLDNIERRKQYDEARLLQVKEEKEAAAEKRRLAKAARSLAAKTKPRELTANEQSKRANNNQVKADRLASLSRTNQYLGEQWEHIAPFVGHAGVVPPPVDATQLGHPNASPVWDQLPLTTQPACLHTVTLRDYQLAGLNWLINMYKRGVNCILGDEMGLGKTVQTITLMTWLTKHANVPGPHLVIVPLSVLTNWMNEFKRFAPQMRVVKLHTSDSNERSRLIKEVLSDVTSFDVALTTYAHTHEKQKNPASKNTETTSSLSRLQVRHGQGLADEDHPVRAHPLALPGAGRGPHHQERADAGIADHAPHALRARGVAHGHPAAKQLARAVEHFKLSAPYALHRQNGLCVRRRLRPLGK
jgi:hypothetical protein